MTTTQTHGNAEAYLAGSFEVDPDYVDGQIRQRNVGEFSHASWQKAIIHWFILHEAEWRLGAYPEYRVQVRAENFQVPDVTLLDEDAPAERYATLPPVAVFEVLSPEDQPKRVLERLARFQQMGIGIILQVDPETSAWSRFMNGRLQGEQRFTLAEKRIDFPLAEITRLVRRAS